MILIGLEIAIILALITVNGLLAMSELALVSSRKHRLEARAREGDRGAERALSLSSEPTRFLSTVQIGITMVGILAGAFGGASIARRVSGWLTDAGLSVSLSDTIGVLAVVAVITYFTLIFGELVPKRVALHAPEGTASLIARPMLLLSRIAAPFVQVLSFSTNTVLRLAGISTQEQETLTEEEIRVMIGQSAESGAVPEKEVELLERVFHFGDRHVHEVMVPRTEAVGVERHARVSDFFTTYLEAPHSRFPVFDESLDEVVGILGIKEVLAAISSNEADESSPIEPLARPAYFVPESKFIGDLFREMQASGIQMAVAVDEFGGTAGIVTLEQLLEEMVGQVWDEMRPRELEITPIDENTTQIDGGLSVEEAREELGIQIPEGPYDTVAGYVLNALGHIPKVGEVVGEDRFRITVSEMSKLKIESLRVTKT